MKKLSLILVSLLILISGFKKGYSPTVDTNSKFKAVFIYNFTKYIEWPKAYRDGDFVVGVIGESPLYQELVKMAKTKKVANQSLKIIKYNSLNDLHKCHILYLSRGKSSEIYKVIKKVKSNSTLIITEEGGLADKGSGINFIVKNNRLKFELNKTNVEKHKLKISSSLEALAIIVK